MRTLLAAVLAFALLGAPSYAQTVGANPTPADMNAQLQALQAQLDALKAQIDAIKAQQAITPITPLTPAPTATVNTENFIRLKPNSPTVTFLIGKKDELTVYGNLNVSFDDSTKGLQKFYAFSGDSPVGNVGWLPAISTNSTYLGARGFHKIADRTSFVYQLEAGIAFTAISGTANTNSSNDTTVQGGLTTRPTYMGIQSDAGRFLVGKTYTPYRNSTYIMNPFASQIGDYAVVMGNTGGDNRVEFGYVIDHAIWYESPTWKGLRGDVLFSPGQNRGYDDSMIPAGESSCAGQNAPGSGAIPPFCNDGAFGNLFSADLQYKNGPFYFTTAYEMHKKTNRVSDLANLDPNDVADEDAFKIGSQYVFHRLTTLNFIWENFNRYVPAYLMYQNERQRNGFWLAATQQLGYGGFSIGWARANPTPGDPGQHNTPATAFPDNMANMYTATFRAPIDRHTGWYIAYADTVNHAAAHYDLGAGGHGVTTDCHDASILAAFDATVSPPISGNGPHCYAGGHIQGFSVGLTAQF